MPNNSNVKEHAIIKLELFNKFNLVNLDLQDLDHLPKLAKNIENISDEDLQLYFQSGYETAVNNGIIAHGTSIDELQYSLYESSDGPHEVVISFKPEYRKQIFLKKVQYIINENGSSQIIHADKYEIDKKRLYFTEGADLLSAKEFITNFLVNRNIIPEPGPNNVTKFRKSFEGDEYVFILASDVTNGDEPEQVQSEEAAFEEALQAGFQWQVPQHQAPTQQYNDPHGNVPLGPLTHSNNNSYNNPIRNANTNYNYNNSMNPSGGRRRRKTKRRHAKRRVTKKKNRRSH